MLLEFLFYVRKKQCQLISNSNKSHYSKKDLIIMKDCFIIKSPKFKLQGGEKSLCPPASEMMLNFPIMSLKMTFLQWNH
jgi:hypothetical protein